MINNVFISFSAVEIYDLSYVHLQEMLRWRPPLHFTLSPILVVGFITYIIFYLISSFLDVYIYWATYVTF